MNIRGSILMVHHCVARKVFLNYRALVVMVLMINLGTACGHISPLPTQSTAPLVFTTVAALTPIPMTPVATRTAAAKTCTPNHDDGLSPSYQPDAPIRTSVGHGHVLTGVVLSSLDCAPVANAQLELWPEYPDQGHPDKARATIFTDNAGRYRFECDLPEHIHMRISAPGYRTLAQNSYHPNGKAEGTFDIVLVPESP
jgi:protocatechuate 3,4-dioxygenase beta subunit